MANPPKRWNLFYVGLVGMALGALGQLSLARTDASLSLESAIASTIAATVIALLLGWIRNRLLGFQ